MNSKYEAMREALVDAWAVIHWIAHGRRTKGVEVPSYDEAENRIQSALAMPDDAPVAIVREKSTAVGGTFIQRLAELKPGQSLYATPVVPALDAERALRLLQVMFEAYEDGTPCYDNPEDGAFVGQAFRLDDETFKNITDLLYGRSALREGK